MAFSYRELFFGSNKFCCGLLGVRIGVLVMCVLGMLFSGMLAILVWFEVSSTPELSSKARAMFIVAGLVETLLFVVSMLGFVGAVVRKQLFIQIYAYFVYFHFVLNIGVAAFLFYELVHVSTTDQNKACQLAIKDANAQTQCTNLLKVGLGVYAAVAAVVLLTELYGAIIVARYVNQIQREKRNLRASRISQGTYRMSVRPPSGRYSSLPDDSEASASLRAASSRAYDEMEDFNPYERDVRTANAYDPHPMSGPDASRKAID
ncbi:DUF1746 domain-containing protein [Mycena kentingensis (nom. inval.)]|nr:DUF1746 domain-containing protein [Mycena kentingensis (nom. inval.)]